MHEEVQKMKQKMQLHRGNPLDLIALSRMQSACATYPEGPSNQVKLLPGHENAVSVECFQVQYNMPQAMLLRGTQLHSPETHITTSSKNKWVVKRPRQQQSHSQNARGP
jgi:hypothetical protein